MHFLATSHLAQGILHFVIVCSLVEMAGEQLGQRFLQHIATQEQEPTEHDPVSNTCH